MRKYWIVILILASLSASAQLGKPVYDNIHTDYDRNCLLVSPSLDLKLFILGDQRYNESFGILDTKHRVQLRVARLWHPFIAWEHCGWAELEALTGGVQYKFLNGYWSALAGVEGGRIHNQGKTDWTYGINFEVEKWTPLGIAWFYLGDYLYRPNLANPRFIYSGRIGVKIILD